MPTQPERRVRHALAPGAAPGGPVVVDRMVALFGDALLLALAPYRPSAAAPATAHATTAPRRVRRRSG